MPNNAINNVNESTVKKLGGIMGNMAHAIFTDHADSIIERLQEEALDNEGATQITVPMKMLIIHNEEGEFEIKPSIDLKKTIKTTFEMNPVKWNPNQPDLFEKQASGPAPEPDEAGTLEPGSTEDKKNKKKPGKGSEKKSYKFPWQDPDFNRCEHKHPKFGLQCTLEKGHEGECKPLPCFFVHDDGKRICVAEKGHDGMHTLIDRDELDKYQAK